MRPITSRCEYNRACLDAVRLDSIVNRLTAMVDEVSGFDDAPGCIADALTEVERSRDELQAELDRWEREGPPPEDALDGGRAWRRRVRADDHAYPGRF